MKFKEKYYQIAEKNNSLVCVGLDSDIEKIPEHLKKEYEFLQFQFNKHIIDSTKDLVAAYKPNFAFYISQGIKGIESLQKTISYIPADIPVILDVKVGDIGNTMMHYAKAYLDVFNVDALTVNPLMGYDVIDPFEQYEDKYLFLLALTSNPSNTDFLNSGNMLYEGICEKIQEWDQDMLGAVVGATNDEEMSTIRGILPNSLFLIPGIGAQGGNLEKVIKYTTGKDHPNILINSSRGIIFSYSKENEKDFDVAARDACKELQERINSYL